MRSLSGQRQEELHLMSSRRDGKKIISLVRLITGIGIAPMLLAKGRLGRSLDTYKHHKRNYC